MTEVGLAIIQGSAIAFASLLIELIYFIDGKL